jgi:murein DD-endopeptidase MepM/ murein hydrolase activator NlpD
MKTVIKESEAKTIELSSKQQQLDSKKGEYLQKLKSLGEVKEELEDTYTDIKQDIAESKLLLAYYEKVGCKMDDDLDTCAGTLPYNASYKLPVSVIAKISSDFGPRYVSGCRSCSTFHYGADIAVGYGTVLYPIANGIVTSISGANDKSTAAGLSLTIIYNIKGNYYTSTYAHLSEVLTSVGKVVSVNSVVAKSGNSGSSTTGAHLHFGFTKKARYVSSGLYGIPSSEVYTSYTAYKNNSFANNCTDYSVCESRGYKGIIENYYYFPYGAYTTGR